MPLLLSLLFKFTNVCATVDASFRMLYPDGTACQHGNEEEGGIRLGSFSDLHSPDKSYMAKCTRYIVVS